MAGCLYKHHSKHTSNSGFDRSFMPCSGYILFAAEQRVGYQISWVDLRREVHSDKSGRPNYHNLSACSNDIQESNYKTLLRPQLEYAAISLYHLQRQAQRMSKLSKDVQPDCAELVYNHRTSSVTSMIQSLGLEDLQHRIEQCKTVKS